MTVPHLNASTSVKISVSFTSTSKTSMDILEPPISIWPMKLRCALFPHEIYPKVPASAVIQGRSRDASLQVLSICGKVPQMCAYLSPPQQWKPYHLQLLSLAFPNGTYIVPNYHTIHTRCNNKRPSFQSFGRLGLVLIIACYSLD